MKKVSIMDIDFINITKKDLLNNYLYRHLDKKEKCYIVTANPEIVMKTKEDYTYKQTVQKADYVVPDGIGILIAAKYLKNPLSERISGYDLMIDLLEYAHIKGLHVYFLGAEESVNKKAVEKAKQKYSNLKIAGSHHGFFDIDDQEVVEEVRKSNADIVFVALGFPKQEEWIVRHIDYFSKGIFIGVGGSFDVLAEKVKRAPDIWIKLNLEWLYRLIQQPFRIKRVLKVFQFMIKIILRRNR